MSLYHIGIQSSDWADTEIYKKPKKHEPIKHKNSLYRSQDYHQ